jgi:hypothetical protein
MKAGAIGGGHWWTTRECPGIGVIGLQRGLPELRFDGCRGNMATSTWP